MRGGWLQFVRGFEPNAKFFSLLILILILFMISSAVC